MHAWAQKDIIKTKWQGSVTQEDQKGIESIYVYDYDICMCVHILYLCIYSVYIYMCMQCMYDVYVFIYIYKQCNYTIMQIQLPYRGLVRTRRVLFLNINPYLWGALFGTDFYRGTGQLMFWNVVWEITLNKLPSGTVFLYLLFNFPDDCINRKTCSSFGRHLP